MENHATLLFFGWRNGIVIFIKMIAKKLQCFLKNNNSNTW